MSPKKDPMNLLGQTIVGVGMSEDGALMLVFRSGRTALIVGEGDEPGVAVMLDPEADLIDPGFRNIPVQT